MIDEKKLLEVINEVYAEGLLAEYGFDKLVEAQPKIGGWISVEDMLPDKPEENPECEGKPLELYLVSVRDVKYPFRAFWNGENFTDGWCKVGATAWMPLPEPYQPKEG